MPRPYFVKEKPGNARYYAACFEESSQQAHSSTIDPSNIAPADGTCYLHNFSHRYVAITYTEDSTLPFSTNSIGGLPDKSPQM